MTLSTIYLIPSFLHEEATDTLSPAVLNAVKKCEVFFVEEARTARRFLKSIWKEMVIDNYQWEIANKDNVNDPALIQTFLQTIRAGKTIGIISEAGCPGVADPGQALVQLAHREKARVVPLVGPSSILLALMASGMSGQQFRFVGYLPIDRVQRAKAIREMEQEAQKKQCTQIFMETPYRNNQLLESLMETCQPQTALGIAANITGPNEFIRTSTIAEWKKKLPDLHKQPVIFTIY